MTDNTNDTHDKKKSEFGIGSILKYMCGVVSGAGIACAFLVSPYFFLVFGLGFFGYARCIESERRKKTANKR